MLPDELPRTPQNLRPFDFWHEKVSLTQFAHKLMSDGWPEVSLSVPPGRIDDGKPLDGKPPQDLGDEFRSKFDAEPIAGETAFRYNFYRDQPGYFDLVARRDGEAFIVEGKGRSATNRRGAIAQMVGSHVLERRAGRSDLRYAILLPGGTSPGQDDEDAAEVRRWDRALRNFGGIDWIEVHRISRDGVIVRDDWAVHR